MLSDDIYKYLISVPAIVDVIPAANIAFIDYPVQVTEGSITYYMISDPIAYDRPISFRWQRWRFKITHSDKEVLESFAETVLGLLHNYKGSIGDDSIVSNISCISNGSTFKSDSASIYELNQDYRINLH